MDVVCVSRLGNIILCLIGEWRDSVSVDWALGSMIMMMTLEEHFWRETQTMTTAGGGGGDGSTWTWTWTLAALLLIIASRFLSARFRRRPPPLPVSSAATPTTQQQHALRIISDLDLKNLINHLDQNSPDDIWENVIEKTRDSVSYKAKCCKPKDGPLKYLSVTTFEDCSVEALLNFYMDNHYRQKWDTTVIQHHQLQLDPDSGIEIGRTIKKFPFLTPREYVLAWKLWQGVDGSFYCFSKECEHPLAPKEKKYVRVAVFRSGWRIRQVPGRNACEISMVHQEDAGLNVEMAKLAFAKRIWSYVCKMDDALRKYSTGLNSTAIGSMSIQKVPPELEARNDTMSREDEVNSSTSVGSCRLKTRKVTRRPSSKLITNGLVLLGGAVCLSRVHSSLGAKVAMAYILTKLTKRGSSNSRSPS